MKKLVAQEKKSTNRRDFLKKTVYHAPSLIIMGTLAKPIAAHGSPIPAPPNVRSRRPTK